MSEFGELRQAQVFVTNWQTQKEIYEVCQCSYDRYSAGQLRRMLPMAEIQQTSSGFKVTLFWVCATCGRRKGA